MNKISTPQQVNPTHIAAAISSILRPARISRKASLLCAATLGTSLLMATPLYAQTFEVTNHDDTGPGSLRDAITLANNSPGADAIIFDSKVTGTIPVSSGELSVTDTLTINGPGTTALTLDGSNTNRIINNSSSLILSGLTLARGYAIDVLPYSSGGAILTTGNLTINNCVIENNYSSYGGGIAVEGNADEPVTLEINNSYLNNNFAGQGGSGIDLYSSNENGAIGLVGASLVATTDAITATINNTTITDNGTTKSKSGGGINIDASGGNISLEINASQVTKNSAAYGGGIASAGQGGVSTVQVNSSVSSYASLTINDSTISGNNALTGGGIFNGNSGKAAKKVGAPIIGAMADSTITINRSTISGNTADFGGGIANVSGYDQSVAIVANNSTISGNTAFANGVSGSYGYGGGIYNKSDYGNSFVMLNNVTLANNVGEFKGDNVYSQSEDVSADATITFNNTILTSNNVSCYATNSNLISLGYNISSDSSCNLADTSDQQNMDAMVGMLDDNGGPTKTNVLLAGSLAIDAIPVGTNGCGTTLTMDQRGYLRPANGACDIGAFEVSAPGTGKIGDKVWEDLNQNGIQDNNEPGLDYVMMNLRSCNSPAILKTTMSDITGAYLFDEIPVGNFQIEYILPPDYHFSPEGVGHWSADSNADPNTGLSPCLSMADGQVRLAVDVGAASDTPAGTGKIGDYVWKDLNGNGIQNNNEPGLGGVSIDLLDCNAGDTVVSSTVSAPNGSYMFNTVGVGNFRVRFNPVADHSYSPTSQGYWANDSNAGAGGKSACVAMAAGQVRNGIDGGYKPDNNNGGTGKIGDYVWNDLNANGIQNSNEPGLQNVQVDLYSCDGLNVYVDSKMTDSNGKFLFTGLGASKYRLKFTPLPGYTFSPAGIGGYQNDSNVNVNSGFGPCLSFSTGQSRLHLDAGMHQ